MEQLPPPPEPPPSSSEDPLERPGADQADALLSLRSLRDGSRCLAGGIWGLFGVGVSLGSLALLIASWELTAMAIEKATYVDREFQCDLYGPGLWLTAFLNTWAWICTAIFILSLPQHKFIIRALCVPLRQVGGGHRSRGGCYCCGCIKGETLALATVVFQQVVFFAVSLIYGTSRFVQDYPPADGAVDWCMELLQVPDSCELPDLDPFEIMSLGEEDSCAEARTKVGELYLIGAAATLCSALLFVGFRLMRECSFTR